MSKHTAAFSKIGYLYQIRYALFRSIEDYDAYSIKLESLDDVEITKEEHSELYQLKHHSNDDSLTDKSVDFWKTIGIWSEQIANNELIPEQTRYYLVTTSSVPSDTIASHILKEQRDCDKAVELMDIVAKEITNKKLIKSIGHYLNLSDEQKLALCKSIIILPNEDKIDEITQRIKRRLELSVSIDSVDNLFEQLEGWWFSTVIDFLLGKQETIWRDEVRSKIVNLSYNYHPEMLSIDFKETSLSKDDFDQLMGYQFVKQLELIGVGSERVQHCILDYYKAYHQRTKWIRDDLLLEYDLSNYEENLIDAWKRFRLALMDELSGDENASELSFAGRKILNWAETVADIRIKPRVSDKFIMTGSYHMLSNESPPRVGWHPLFAEKISEIITSNYE